MFILPTDLHNTTGVDHTAAPDGEGYTSWNSSTRNHHDEETQWTGDVSAAAPKLESF